MRIEIYGCPGALKKQLELILLQIGYLTKKTQLILQNGPLRDEMKQSKQLNQLSGILLLEGYSNVLLY